MFRKIGITLLFGVGLALAACGSATPQFIGSYPQTGQTYPNSPPPINYDGPVPQHLQIDYNAALEIEVDHPEWAIGSVKAVAENYGGYLINSETWQESGNDYAMVTIAVPVISFEAAKARLKNLGPVKSESVSGQLHDTGPNYLNEAQTYSNITVTLTPSAANWGRRFGYFVGGVATLLFWIVALVTPVGLMSVGLVTCLRGLSNWIEARRKRQS